jgi:hypothetical protein
MTLMALRKFLVPEGTSRKDFQNLTKLWQNHRVIGVELRRLEHCLPVMVTKFKLNEVISASAFVASHSIQKLINSLMVFWISAMSIYMLVCNYYIFLK